MERLKLRPRQLTPAEAVRYGLKKSDRLRCLDPMTNRPLPNEGASVVPSSYWVRRLACEDVELVKAEARAQRRNRAKPAVED